MKFNYKETTKDLIKEKINKSQISAFEILPIVVTYYGKKTKDDRYTLYLDNDDVFEGYNNNIDWIIEGFKCKEDKSFIVVWWSVDNADGEIIVEIPKPHDHIKVSINPNLYFYIDSDEVYRAIKNIEL